MKSGIAAKKGRALGVSFAEYDDDGFTDIFVANDGIQQYLFHNNGNGTFSECARESGVGLSIVVEPVDLAGKFSDEDVWRAIVVVVLEDGVEEDCLLTRV
jgi:enediyne biosynthesis protein E4